mmetsp:Transcript_7811/g.15711  ORF Transcript_7811/g.15711 Transcript_7811/m.15711 type:complete len:233 (+) Transcript_7811:1908-2606(+)
MPNQATQFCVSQGEHGNKRAANRCPQAANKSPRRCLCCCSSHGSIHISMIVPIICTVIHIPIHGAAHGHPHGFSPSAFIAISIFSKGQRSICADSISCIYHSKYVSHTHVTSQLQRIRHVPLFFEQSWHILSLDGTVGKGTIIRENGPTINLHWLLLQIQIHQIGEHRVQSITSAVGNFCRQQRLGRIQRPGPLSVVNVRLYFTDGISIIRLQFCDEIRVSGRISSQAGEKK